MSQEEWVTEAELIEAIRRVDRFRSIGDGALPAHTSALAEVWGTMIYERTSSMAVSRFTAPQLAALQASRQGELLALEN